MKDYLVYHNPDAMGVDVSKVDPFAIVTNKPAPDDVVGSRVWLLTSIGKPRHFFLRSCFIVADIELNVGGFRTRLSGTKGTLLEPMPELNDEDWFPELKKSQGNFAFGLQCISNTRAIHGLERIALRVAKNDR